MSHKIPGTKVTGIRVSSDVDQRVQAVAAELSRRAAGVPITITAAMTKVILSGLDALEAELGLKPAAKKTKAA
jgi:hypothetical protein